MLRSTSSADPDLLPSGVEWRIPAGAGGFHRAAWYRPQVEDAPLVLHLHAGAFVGAPPAGRTTLVERLLLQAGASVVSLQYPLAPAHPFPQALFAAHESLEHMHRERRRLSGAKAQIFVAGIEAGGNIAAGLALMVRDRNEPDLAGQLLFSPMLDPRIATNSQRRAASGRAGCPLAEGWRQYAARPSDAAHPYANPAHAVRLDRMPRTLLVTADGCPFSDETRAYHRRLRDQRVDATLLSLPSPRSFVAACMHETPAQAPWMAAAGDTLRRFLAGAHQPLH